MHIKPQGGCFFEIFNMHLSGLVDNDIFVGPFVVQLF